jgi:hypothetical protein
LLVPATAFGWEGEVLGDLDARQGDGLRPVRRNRLRILGERRRYEERFRALFREGRELGCLRTDESSAALLALSALNWAYTWPAPAGTATSSPTAFTRY